MQTNGRITDILRELGLYDFEYEKELDEAIGSYTYNVLYDRLSLRLGGCYLDITYNISDRLDVLSKIRISTIVRCLYSYFKFSKLEIEFNSFFMFDGSSTDTCFKEILKFNRLKHLEIIHDYGDYSSPLTLSIDESINKSNLESLRVSDTISVKFDDVFRLSTLKSLSVTIMDDESLQTVYNSLNIENLILNIRSVSIFEKKKWLYEDYIMNKNTYILEKTIYLKMLVLIGNSPRFLYLSGMFRNFGKIDELLIVNTNNDHKFSEYTREPNYDEMWRHKVYGMEENY